MGHLKNFESAEVSENSNRGEVYTFNKDPQYNEQMNQDCNETVYQKGFYPVTTQMMVYDEYGFEENIDDLISDEGMGEGAPYKMCSVKKTFTEDHSAKFKTLQPLKFCQDQSSPSPRDSELSIDDIRDAAPAIHNLSINSGIHSGGIINTDTAKRDDKKCCYC